MQIINRRTYRGRPLPDGSVYVGRAMPRIRLAGSPLGNPYHLTHADRQAVCEEYFAWLNHQIDEGNRAVLVSLALLDEDSVLACWCLDRPRPPQIGDPLVCHAQVIEAIWHSRRDEIAQTRMMPIASEPPRDAAEGGR